MSASQQSIFANVPRNPLVNRYYELTSRWVDESVDEEDQDKEDDDDDDEDDGRERKTTGGDDDERLSRHRTGAKTRNVRTPSSTMTINESAQCFVRHLTTPYVSGSTIVRSFAGPEMFVAMTKKMRQQIMSRIFAHVHRQLVVYNVKALFRIYMIYHRDDRLIHAICDVFSKRNVFDASELRHEIVQKNTKELTPKAMRNKMCQRVMSNNPNILRLFDTRTLTYCREFLSDAGDVLHDMSNRLPVIMCLNESDVDTMFERCRTTHSRRDDFPIDLLPTCIRRPIARLLGMRRQNDY